MLDLSFSSSKKFVIMFLSTMFLFAFFSMNPPSIEAAAAKKITRTSLKKASPKKVRVKKAHIKKARAQKPIKVKKASVKRASVKRAQAQKPVKVKKAPVKKARAQKPVKTRPVRKAKSQTAAQAAAQQAERARVAREQAAQVERERVAQEQAAQQAERERATREQAARQSYGPERLRAELTLIRNLVGPYSEAFIQAPITSICQLLLNHYNEANKELVTAIVKRIRFKVEEYDEVDTTSGVNPFQKMQNDLGRGDDSDFLKYQQDMKSCERMIKRTLANEGIPPVNAIPDDLKINPWMIYSPHLDQLNARQGVGTIDINQPVNNAQFTQAQNKIVALFNRLVNEQKITPIKLVDYEDIPEYTRIEFDQYRNRYPNIISWATANGRFLPVAAANNLSNILEKTNRTKNRAVTLANMIWNQGGGQVIPDNNLIPILARLAIGGRHCSTRADDDSSWAVAKVGGARIGESQESLEIKAASLLLVLKKKAIADIVTDQRDAGGEGRTQLAHIQCRIEQRLGPHIGLLPDSSTFVDQYGLRTEYSTMPIQDLLRMFNAKLTQDFLEEGFTTDINNSLKFVNNPTLIQLTRDETRNKTPRQIAELRRAKFNAQQKGTIRFPDIQNYLENTSQRRAGIPDVRINDILDGEDDNELPITTQIGVRRLLYGLGYLEEDD